MTRKTVILAAGIGRRMQRQQNVPLTPEQTAMADAGLKALIPVGRPFLEYCLSALAQVGVRQVCLVIAAGDYVLREHFANLETQRLEISFAVQQEPKGTADALLSAEGFTAGDPFLIVNSDNYYPADVLRELSALDEPGLIAFRRRALVESEHSNITADRIRGYALVQIDEEGYLTSLLEKPDQETYDALEEPVCVSMNCWRFSSEIYSACRAIEPSPRGEMELTAAVEWGRHHQGLRFRALISDGPVMDLSQRIDIPVVARLLRGVETRL